MRVARKTPSCPEKEGFHKENKNPNSFKEPKNPQIGSKLHRFSQDQEVPSSLDFDEIPEGLERKISGKTDGAPPPLGRDEVPSSQYLWYTSSIPPPSHRIVYNKFQLFHEDSSTSAIALDQGATRFPFRNRHIRSEARMHEQFDTPELLDEIRKSIVYHKLNQSSSIEFCGDYFSDNLTQNNGELTTKMQVDASQVEGRKGSRVKIHGKCKCKSRTGCPQCRLIKEREDRFIMDHIVAGAGDKISTWAFVTLTCPSLSDSKAMVDGVTSSFSGMLDNTKACDRVFRDERGLVGYFFKGEMSLNRFNGAHYHIHLLMGFEDVLEDEEALYSELDKVIYYDLLENKETVKIDLNQINIGKVFQRVAHNKKLVSLIKNMMRFRIGENPSFLTNTSVKELQTLVDKVFKTEDEVGDFSKRDLIDFFFRKMTEISKYVGYQRSLRSEMFGLWRNKTEENGFRFEDGKSPSLERGVHVKLIDADSSSSEATLTAYISGSKKGKSLKEQLTGELSVQSKLKSAELELTSSGSKKGKNPYSKTLEQVEYELAKYDVLIGYKNPKWPIRIVEERLEGAYKGLYRKETFRVSKEWQDLKGEAKALYKNSKPKSAEIKNSVSIFLSVDFVNCLEKAMLMNPMLSKIRRTEPNDIEKLVFGNYLPKELSKYYKRRGMDDQLDLGDCEDLCQWHVRYKYYEGGPPPPPNAGKAS